MAMSLLSSIVLYIVPENIGCRGLGFRGLGLRALEFRIITRSPYMTIAVIAIIKILNQEPMSIFWGYIDYSSSRYRESCSWHV